MFQDNRVNTGMLGSFGRPQMPNAGLDGPLLSQMIQGAESAPDPGIASPMGGLQGLLAKMGGMGGLDGLGTAMDGLGSLGGIYTSLKGLGLAKDQMNFQKQAFNTNMTNQTKTYNTALEDRVRSRTHAEGGTPQQAEQYLSKNKL